jgi:hypothetical protein
MHRKPKLSAGLEPATPSSPSWGRCGKRGHDVVRGSNHYGFLESPETVLAVVEPFLAAHVS